MPRPKTCTDGLTKQQRYKAKHADEVRAYHRDYMRKRRGSAKRKTRKVKP